MIRDVGGIYGSLWHYSMVFTMVGSAFFIFIHLWRKGRLDMDEEAKYQMMQSDEEENGNGK